MSDEKIIIKGRVFTKEQLVKQGWRIIFSCWVGIIMVLLMVCGLLALELPNLVWPIIGGASLVIFIVVIVGVVFPKHILGKWSYQNSFDTPINFDGKPIELILAGDTKIKLSSSQKIELIIDKTNKLIQLKQAKGSCYYTEILKESDIHFYEIRSEESVLYTSSSRNEKGFAKTLVGGLLFGTLGAVAGAISENSNGTTTNLEKRVNSYTLLLEVNNPAKPFFEIELDNLEVVRAFMIAIQDFDIKDSEEENTTETPIETPEVALENNKVDKFEEIKKYKELLDSGIISQEEFDRVKNKLFRDI